MLLIEGTEFTTNEVREAAMRAILGRDDLGEVKLILARVLKLGAWIYQGGSHLAVHERVPTRRNPNAGRCLIRVRRDS